MACVIGYANFQSYSVNTRQILLLLKRLLPSTDLKFGGFDYQPVIWKLPSGYARTGAYIRQSANDWTSGSNTLILGVCDFDTLTNTYDAPGVTTSGSNFMIFYEDTREFIKIGDNIYMFLRLLDLLTLNPVCYAALHSSSGIFMTSDSITTGNYTLITPEPIRAKNTVKVSRVYFLTPLGILTTDRLYSANSPTVRYGTSISIGTRKYIQVGSFFVDVTDEV
jgi:hypothetical protein